MENIDIGTLEEAKVKVKETFNQFTDMVSKFLALVDYYSEITNYYQPLNDSLVSDYSRYNELLSSCSVEDYYFEIAKECVLYLDFVDEIKENLELYYEAINNKQDPSLSDYDKTYDILTIKDEFQDEMKSIRDTYEIILKYKKVEKHNSDPKYDPVSRSLLERTEELNK